MGKYSVSYYHNATGYGWKEETNRLEDFESFIDEMRADHNANITVWDNTINKFIYWQQGCFYKVDLLSDILRDMRTITREVKR